MHIKNPPSPDSDQKQKNAYEFTISSNLFETDYPSINGNVETLWTSSDGQLASLQHQSPNYLCSNWMKSSARNLLPTMNRDLAVRRDFNTGLIRRKLKSKKGLLVAGLCAAGLFLYKGNHLFMEFNQEQKEMVKTDARRLAERLAALKLDRKFLALWTAIQFLSNYTGGEYRREENRTTYKGLEPEDQQMVRHEAAKALKEEGKNPSDYKVYGDKLPKV